MLAAALGRPLRFIITPGQTGDITQAPALLEGQDGEAVLAYKAYKQRNRIERCFNRFKHFHRFATRYDRRTIHFKGFTLIAAAMIWLR